MRPIVTLTTDFGTQDAYVAQMKGVLLSEGPESLRIEDLSHEIAAHDVSETALFLRSAVPRFPRGTLHVVVVDPGVGSARKPIIVRVGGQTLVGPDNGCFGYLFDGQEQVHAIDVERLDRPWVSSTFHGRDIFAPVAARLAAGAAPAELGERLERYEHVVFPLVELEGDRLHGRVIHVDRFGNLITNVSRRTLEQFLGEGGEARARVHVAGHTLPGIHRQYAQAARSQLLALLGSDDLLEVAAREDHAAGQLQVGTGAPVHVERVDEGAK